MHILLALGVLFGAMVCGCASAPRRAVDEPSRGEIQEDIDVLSEDIDCRRNMKGKVTVDPACCKESSRATGC